MATMVKEKKQKKKKTSPKIDESVSNTLNSSVCKNNDEKSNLSSCIATENIAVETSMVINETNENVKLPEDLSSNSTEDLDCSKENPENNKELVKQDHALTEKVCTSAAERMKTYIENNIVNTEHETEHSLLSYVDKNEATNSASLGNTYEEVNKRLERIQIPDLKDDLNTQQLEDSLSQAHAYLKPESIKELVSQEEILISEKNTENVVPSAPLFEEDIESTHIVMSEQITTKVTLKERCMPLSEAIKLFGEREMAEVQAMSEREEAIVAAGPISGPEHPLVDLLSTFSNALKALEREKVQFRNSQVEEEKYRSTLWKVEQQKLYLMEKCGCGSSVSITATYDDAKLLMERLPIARVKLEALLKDLQESYCHYLHDALLAYYQINDFVAEITKANKADIREALSLILQALRLYDSGPQVLTDALQRWAEHLVAALVDGQDLRQLLFVMHHLFRQTRSVSWAGPVLALRASNEASALAVLAVLLLHSTPDRDELDIEELWEEVDRQGSGGGVSENTLREKDLLLLTQALSPRLLLMRILLFTTHDIKSCSSYEWGDHRGGRGVLRAACGVRVLASVLRRAAAQHAAYTRLRRRLAGWLRAALWGLAALHCQSRSSYLKELEPVVMAQLEACFAAGLGLMEPSELHQLPSTLLDDDTAKEYCMALIHAITSPRPIRLDSLSTDLPPLSGSEVVNIVTMLVVNRTHDRQLARTVMGCLFQHGIRVPLAGKGGCAAAARDSLRRLLHAHAYLRIEALRTIADLSQVEKLDASAISSLSVEQLRASRQELVDILQQFSSRCPHLLEPLLMALDYTPHTGLSYDVQLSIGAWLCSWVSGLPAPAPWPWLVLRKLSLHRTQWGYDLAAPDPEPSEDLFRTTFSLLSSSWGHCIPLICEFGVTELIKLANTRVEDAVHCLQYIVLVLSHSPESISLTPKFSELVGAVWRGGPGVLRRALSRAAPSGELLLLRLLATQLTARYAQFPRARLLSCWLQLLWRGPAAALDAALLLAREWAALDTHVQALLQEPNAHSYISEAVQNAAAMPLACEAILRHAHAILESRQYMYCHLLDAVWRQKLQGNKIHVDNALKELGVEYSSSSLVVFSCACAVQAAAPAHPAHLSLWRLFFHLYLQKPPSSNGTGPAIGPLLFSGLINSRIIAKLKKQLQTSQAYHIAESEAIKVKINEYTKETVVKPERKSKNIDDEFLPSITINDLTGEAIVDNEEENVKEDAANGEKEREDEKRSLEVLCSYHVAAANLCNTYYILLEKGEDVVPEPWHTNLAAFVPEREFQCALNNYIDKNIPKADKENCVSAVVAGPKTPFELAVEALSQVEDQSDNSVNRRHIKSTLDGVNFRDRYAVKSLVDKHFKLLQNIASSWSAEAARVSALDAALAALERRRRRPRALPAVQRVCANRCKPLTFVFSVEEWCRDLGVESEINQNRSSAKAMLRQLARPRFEAAQAAALLNAVARGTAEAESAVAMACTAWRASTASGRCVPVTRTLTNLVQLLAERWICHNGQLVASLIKKWGDTPHPLQQSLCGLLLNPRVLAPCHWPAVYSALLQSKLAAHNLFSYLSRFELSRWVESCGPGLRENLLTTIVAAAQCFGGSPDESQHVLIELLGVHTACLLSASTLAGVLTACSRACLSGRTPLSYYRHIVAAVPAHARLLTFDQLGNLLRALGEVWWEARGAGPGAGLGAGLAPAAGALLAALQRAFVAAAMELSYAPERVALYAWSSLQESWSAWILPHPELAPLLPPTRPNQGFEEVCTDMMKLFVDTVLLVMQDCPGIEPSLLQQIFPWSLQTCDREALDHLRALPWHEHSWINQDCIDAAVQSCKSHPQVSAWCVHATRACAAADWLRAAGGEAGEGELVPHTLAKLLYLFLHQPYDEQTLSNAGQLPWWRLPPVAREQALQSFFAENHNPNVPYHTLPQFGLMLSACCMSGPAPAACAAACEARASCVSHAARALAAPALLPLVAAHCRALLAAILDIAPQLDDSVEELVELLGRAMVILCIEPAAAAALPVWEEHVRVASERVLSACVSAVSRLTQPTYFARLADLICTRYLSLPESGGWAYIVREWAGCEWRDVTPLVRVSALHAGLAAAAALPPHPAHPAEHAPAPRQLAAAVRALQASTAHFVENEVIIALWICYLVRMGVSSAASESGTESRHAITSLLTAWSEQTSSLFRVITLQRNQHAPTNKHRVLCQLGLCVLTGSESAGRGYQAACTELLGSSAGDVSAWGSSPNLSMMARLAVRMFPNHEIYFQMEADLTTEDK